MTNGCRAQEGAIPAFLRPDPPTPRPRCSFMRSSLPDDSIRPYGAGRVAIQIDITAFSQLSERSREHRHVQLEGRPGQTAFQR